MKGNRLLTSKVTVLIIGGTICIIGIAIMEWVSYLGCLVWLSLVPYAWYLNHEVKQ